MRTGSGPSGPGLSRYTLGRGLPFALQPRLTMTATATAPVRPALSVEPLILLVVPPFQGLACPALGVSQLKGNLLQHGFRSEVLYLNLAFADRVGAELYEWISGTGPYLLGDFLFSCLLHGYDEAHVERYAREVLAGSDVERGLLSWSKAPSVLEALKRLIAAATEFVQNEAMTEVLARGPWMVGLSSTFQSNCASLAIIRELKRRRPETITVIGGANCEAEMGAELRRLYAEVDYVGRGECDRTFVELVRTLRQGGAASAVDGFLAVNAAKATKPSKPLHGPELDAQALPDFDDYFAQLPNRKVRAQIRAGLAMETSRGCWWGAKSHCTFCAFNREGMVFRSKSPERALHEIETLAKRYGLKRMEITDNILDLGYFKSLVPKLAADGGYTFFWEVKANLSESQMRIMRAAGIRWIQPGIESLSDLTLKLMRKGSSQLQNVQLLKQGTESGVRVSWNWLFGFPGEDEQELDALDSTVQTLHHLQPPSSTSVLYLERFAPYHTSPQEWGLTGVRPAKAYAYVYPFPPESLDRVAFFFECEYFTGKQQGAAYQRLREVVGRWKRVQTWAHLLAVPGRHGLVILDTRPVATRFYRRLTGLRRRVYEFCGRIRGEREIAKAFEAEATPQQLADIVQSFADQRLLLRRNGRCLAVATDVRLGYRDYPPVFPGGGIVEHQAYARESRWHRLRRRLADLLLLRTTPKRVAQRWIVRAALKRGRRYFARHATPIGELDVLASPAGVEAA